MGALTNFPAGLAQMKNTSRGRQVGCGKRRVGLLMFKPTQVVMVVWVRELLGVGLGRKEQKTERKLERCLFNIS